MTSAVEEHRERRAVARRGGDEIDGAAQRARAVGERVGATRHAGVARAQRIDDAIVIVAIGRRDRQSILEQLDAVLVVVGGVEIGATTREEQFLGAAAAFGPHAGHVAQHVREPVDVSAIQLLALHDRDAAGRQGALRFDLRLQPLRRHEDALLQRLHGEPEIGHCRSPDGGDVHSSFH